MRTLRIVVALGLIGVLVSPVSAIEGPCKLATKGDSSVAKACVKGGAKEAKKEMERLVKQAKAKTGTKPECDSCHDGINDGHYDVLKKDGRSQFDKMLASLK
jgi:hypothetical protein